MNVLSLCVCVCVHHMNAWYLWHQKRAVDSFEPNLQLLVSHQVDAKTQTQSLQQEQQVLLTDEPFPSLQNTVKLYFYSSCILRTTN